MKMLQRLWFSNRFDNILDSPLVKSVTKNLIDCIYENEEKNGFWNLAMKCLSIISASSVLNPNIVDAQQQLPAQDEISSDIQQ